MAYGIGTSKHRSFSGNTGTLPNQYNLDVYLPSIASWETNWHKYLNTVLNASKYSKYTINRSKCIDGIDTNRSNSFSCYFFTFYSSVGPCWALGVYPCSAKLVKLRYNPKAPRLVTSVSKTHSSAFNSLELQQTSAVSVDGFRNVMKFEIYLPLSYLSWLECYIIHIILATFMYCTHFLLGHLGHSSWALPPKLRIRSKQSWTSFDPIRFPRNSFSTASIAM